MMNWVRTWIQLYEIDVEWAKDMKRLESVLQCIFVPLRAKRAGNFWLFSQKYWIRLLGEMLDVEWTKDMNRKFAKKLGHEMENENSTSNIPLLPYLSTLQ